MKALAALLALLSAAALAEDFKFDASEFEKKTFEYNGYLELKQEALRLNTDTAGFTQSYPGEAQRNWLARSTGTVDLGGKLNLDQWVANLHGQASYADDAYASRGRYDRILDGGLRYSPSDSWTFDAGKRVQRWGRGYAFNPVGLIERPKDPNDTQAAREGYVMAGLDWIKSLNGPVKTVGLTAYALPQDGSKLNSDFGKGQHGNPAAKLYLLAWDTDIDFVWLGKGSRAQAAGFDFARNLGSDLEIHGEWARTFAAPRTLLDSSGTVSNVRRNQDSYLLGARYITADEVTWIAEYYHNGAGYDRADLENYYRLAESARQPGASSALVSKVRSLAQSGFGKANLGRDYAYLRASVNEPFAWLYVNTALTAMGNLQDGSFQLTPELGYTGVTNLELRTRLIGLWGGARTEFGEKTSRARLELSARYSF